jgi:hypothetical protein
VLRPFVRADGVEDLVTGFRLVRVSVLRDLTRARGEAPVADGRGWAALVDFALAVVPYARRVEVVDLPGRYDLRPRDTRLDWWRDLRVLAGYAWRARGRRVTAGSRVGERGPERPARAERPAGRDDVAVVGAVSALTLLQEGAEPARGERPARADRDRRGMADGASRSVQSVRSAPPARPGRSPDRPTCRAARPSQSDGSSDPLVDRRASARPPRGSRATGPRARYAPRRARLERRSSGRPSCRKLEQRPTRR